MWNRVNIFSAKRAKAMAGPGSVIGTIRCDRLMISAGRSSGKVDAALARELVGRIGSVKELSIGSVVGMTRNDLFAAPSLFSSQSSTPIDIKRI